jgi:aldehyde:ferredoxin oxidoreductase
VPVPAGPSQGHTARLHLMLDEYYQFRGWDEQGVPEDAKLKELELEGV